jgi:mannose-1-phosphate guanylyltransferase
VTARALILAAGFGTRLGTLSEERPKPMLPVCDVPLIRYALALLRGAGVREIAVNVHHHGALIERELDGEGIHFSREETILGTGGGIRKLADWLTRGGRESFFVVNGKILIDVDLRAVLARHDAAGAAATMVLRETPDAARWGAIDVDDAGRVSKILDIGGPGARSCMFTGVHVLAPRLVERLPPAGESDSIRQAYIPALRAGDRIEGVVYGGYFHEHSTPARYLQGNWNALRGVAQLTYPPAPLTGVDPTAEVHGTVVDPVRIAAGAIVEPGAHLGPDVVVGRRARVRTGAHLERVVVWPDSTADATLTDAIITPRGVQLVHER